MRTPLVPLLVPLVALALTGCGAGLTPITEFGADTAADAETDPPDEDGADDTEPADEETDDPTDSADTDGETGDDLPPALPPQLADLTPTYGPDIGGLTVTLQGNYLDADPVVRFGGVEATVVSVARRQIEVTTPVLGRSGWVDVEVETRGGLVTLPAAWQSWDDAEDETGALLVLEGIDQRGDYWVDPPPPHYATARFGVLDPPRDFEWRELFAPGIDRCANDYIAPVSWDYLPIGAPDVTLRGPTGNLVLDPDPDLANRYRIDDVPWSAIPTSADFDLATIQGGPDWPSFGLIGVVRGTDSFVVNRPNLDRTTPATVQRNDFRFAWGGTPGDYVLLYLTHISESGGRPVRIQTVTCVVQDDGDFTVPFGAWTSWGLTIDDYVLVEIGRVRERTQAMPHDRSDARLVSVGWMVGAVFMN